MEEKGIMQAKEREFGGKGFQQSMKTMKGEEEQEADEEDERDRVAPNMERAMVAHTPRSSVGSQKGRKGQAKETRVLSWADLQ